MQETREFNLAYNMRILRSAYGYSQEEVSKQIAVARQTYSLYENGKRIPDTPTLCRLAFLYHVTTDSLLFGRPGNRIGEASVQEHTVLTENSYIRLSGADAKMVMDYKDLPPTTQREIRDFVRFKKHLLSKEDT